MEACQHVGKYADAAADADADAYAYADAEPVDAHANADPDGEHLIVRHPAWPFGKESKRRG